MTYVRTGSLGFDFSFSGRVSPSGATATARTSGTTTARTSTQPALIIQPTMTDPDLPKCIPDRYVRAAQEWCAEQQQVRGLGATPMPVEYMGAPCRAAQLPVCPAGKEPALTPPPVVRPRIRVVGTAKEPERPAVRVVGTSTARQPAPTAPTSPVAPGVPWWAWGLLAGGALLTVALLRKGKS
jgi:hypothetical protein